MSAHNGSGNPGVRSEWQNGDLVFTTFAGVEILRLSATGVVSIAGVAFPTADGSPGQVLTTDGAGTLTFETNTP